MSTKLSKKRRVMNLIGWIIILSLASYYIIVKFFFPQHSAFKSAVVPSPSPAMITTPTPNPLEDIVQTQLRGGKGTYSVIVKNFKNGEKYAFNENRKYRTASLYKAWVLVIIYQKIQSGELHENDTLSADIPYLNSEFAIPADEAEQTEGTISYTVHDALEKMITISDNYSALLLVDKIKYTSLINFLKKNGMSSSNVGVADDDPMTTANDMSLFLEKLYKGQLLNEQYTAKAIDLLKRTEFNTIIPKYIPQNITAHKTGSLEYDSHDAGLVFTPRGTYLLIMMSTSDAPADAEERMAQVSKAVYQYFINQPEPTPTPFINQKYLFFGGIAILLILLSILIYILKGFLFK